MGRHIGQRPKELRGGARKAVSHGGRGGARPRELEVGPVGKGGATRQARRRGVGRAQDWRRRWTSGRSVGTAAVDGGGRTRHDAVGGRTTEEPDACGA